MEGFVTRLHTGQREDSETDSLPVKCFSLHQRFQSGCANQSASHPRKQAGAWVWIFISF
jgi:hypothetical protein